MGTGRQSPIHDASVGGIAGTHPVADPFQILVAPATADEANTVGLRLVPIACWRVDDIRFAFDSSFVTPDIATEIQALFDLRDRHKKIDPTTGNVLHSPLSIFGHADPVGPDEFNKALSGRRATAIYATLIVNSDPDRAVQLWNQIARAENWGSEQKKVMRTTVPDGVADSGLFRAYMQSLCPERLVLTPKDFLARGADGDGKGDFQGCSSFNPLLIFSKQREDQFEQAAQSQGQAGTAVRNQANAPNRRVMVLLFQIGSKVDFAKWPCPRATEGTAGCIRRFWSDGQNRRMKRLPDQDRMFEKTFDTFACRFYQRISDGSPCHRMAPTLRLRLFDRQAQPLPNAPYFVTMSDRTASGFTDKNGFAFLRDVELPATCEARWSRASALLDSSSKPPDANWQDFEFHHSVFVDLEESNPVSTPPSPVADSRRLSNMGYIFKDTMTENVQAFQRDAALDLSGALADASPKIRAQHDVVIAPPQPSRPEAESSGGDGGSEDG